MAPNEPLPEYRSSTNDLEFAELNGDNSLASARLSLLTPSSAAGDGMGTANRLHTILRNRLDQIQFWLHHRNTLRARFPDPLGRFFNHLDLWKIFSMAVAMRSLIENSNADESGKKQLYNLLNYGVFFLTAAYFLQEMIPELAVFAILTGFGFVIALFMAAVLKVVDGVLAISVIPLYISLLFPVLYKIYKEDVREHPS